MSPASPSAFTLKPQKRLRLGDQLYGQVLEQIVSGALRQGERLPSEKELCRLFEVSRPVVREALMRLQADGLVSAQQGVGTFVARRPPSALTQLAEPGDVASILASFEARAGLECEAAALAAKRRSEQQLSAMRTALSAMQRKAAAREPAIEADMHFHRAIAAASENDYIVQLLDALHAGTERWLQIVLNITASHTSAERARRVYDEHVRIFEAIHERDVELARLMMRSHLDQARRRLTDHQREA